MARTFQRLMLFFLAMAMLIPLSSMEVSAHHAHTTYSYPIYGTGYHYSTYSYGWSGWDYNRVYYRYHYPYHRQAFYPYRPFVSRHHYYPYW